MLSDAVADVLHLRSRAHGRLWPDRSPHEGVSGEFDHEHDSPRGWEEEVRFPSAFTVLAIGLVAGMGEKGMTDTIASGTSSVVFAALTFIINIPLAFRGVNRALVVTAYQSASGWINLFTPTSAVVMGGLGAAIDG